MYVCVCVLLCLGWLTLFVCERNARKRNSFYFCCDLRSLCLLSLSLSLYHQLSLVNSRLSACLSAVPARIRNCASANCSLSTLLTQLSSAVLTYIRSELQALSLSLSHTHTCNFTCYAWACMQECMCVRVCVCMCGHKWVFVKDFRIFRQFHQQILNCFKISNTSNYCICIYYFVCVINKL